VTAEGDSPESRHVYCKLGQSVQRCCDRGKAEYLDIWLGGVEGALRGLHLYGKGHGSGQYGQWRYRMREPRLAEEGELIVCAEICWDVDGVHLC
jgi:hypothetical protein